MKMTLTAEAARSMAFEYEMQEGLRIVATAESTIAAEVEPAIKKAAESGGRQAHIDFHYTRERIYKVIQNILIDNGYKVTILPNKDTLVINW